MRVFCRPWFWVYKGIMTIVTTVFSTVGLGVIYFISAPTAGMALGLSWPTAAFLAWAGYSAAGFIVTVLGCWARELVSRKINVELNRSQNKLFWRCWDKTGLFGLGIISPVTIGPKVAALMGLALGEHPVRLAIAISLGAVPWALGLALATHWGFSLF